MVLRADYVGLRMSILLSLSQFLNVLPQSTNALPPSEIRMVVDKGEQIAGQSGQDLLPMVYEELRRLAAARMAAEWDTSTLQPTALGARGVAALGGSRPTSLEKSRA